MSEVIVKAQNENMNDINNLNRILYGNEWIEFIMPEYEEKNNIITYLIKVDNKIIGRIKVSKSLNSAFISGFGILPEYRGKGYGKSALLETLNNLHNEKVYDVQLDVEIRNKRALNLYKNCGFKEQSVMNYYNISI